MIIIVPDRRPDVTAEPEEHVADATGRTGAALRSPALWDWYHRTATES